MPILPKEIDRYPFDLFDTSEAAVEHPCGIAGGVTEEGATEEAVYDHSAAEANLVHGWAKGHGFACREGWARRWCVFYTRSRREKDLSRRLLQQEIPFFSPLIARRSRSPSGRVRISHVPLFQGYVFACVAEDQRQEALKSNCVSRVLLVTDPVTLVRELCQIRLLIANNAPLTPESKLQPGMPVRIKNGPFAGIEGVVVKRHNRDRLLVSVQFLQQGASFALDDYLLEPI
jgi:transcription antitermination factor NusG